MFSQAMYRGTAENARII